MLRLDWNWITKGLSSNLVFVFYATPIHEELTFGLKSYRAHVFVFSVVAALFAGMLLLVFVMFRQGFAMPCLSNFCCFSLCGICVYGSHHVRCFNGHVVRSQLSFRFHKGGTKKHFMECSVFSLFFWKVDNCWVCFDSGCRCLICLNHMIHTFEELVH